MMMILGLFEKTKVTGSTMKKKEVLEQMLGRLKLRRWSLSHCIVKHELRVRRHAITNLEKNYQDNQDMISRLKAFSASANYPYSDHSPVSRPSPWWRGVTTINSALWSLRRPRTSGQRSRALRNRWPRMLRDWWPGGVFTRNPGESTFRDRNGSHPRHQIPGPVHEYLWKQ